MKPNTETELYAKEARAYLNSARLLHDDALCHSENLVKWDNTNPMYFCLLHATELALKACLHKFGQTPTHSHDIVEIMRDVAKQIRMSSARNTYRGVRKLMSDRVRRNFSQVDHELREEFMLSELEEAQRTPLSLVATFKYFGALGQSTMTKVEFGKVVGNYWHGLRYPRQGMITYPDFEVCAIICHDLIGFAEEDLA